MTGAIARQLGTVCGSQGCSFLGTRPFSQATLCQAHRRSSSLSVCGRACRVHTGSSQQKVPRRHLGPNQALQPEEEGASQTQGFNTQSWTWGLEFRKVLVVLDRALGWGQGLVEVEGRVLGRRAVGGWWHLSLFRWPQGLPTCPPSQRHLPGGLQSSRPGAQPLHRRGWTLFTLPRGPHKPRCPCKPAVLSTPGPGVFARPQVLIFTQYRRVTRSQPAESSAGLSHVSVDLHGHPVQDRDAPNPASGASPTGAELL